MTTTPIWAGWLIKLADAIEQQSAERFARREILRRQDAAAVRGSSWRWKGENRGQG